MDKNMEWIYAPINEPDLENTLEAVEKALGFKLFVWQKILLLWEYSGGTERLQRGYYGNCWR